MQNIIIDINADVGEGLNNEALLMPYLSSCNVACGGHAGTAESMRQIIKLAKENEVKIGAHPSFPDKVNFGRKAIEISNSDLYISLNHQIHNLMVLIAEENSVLHHIKLHGALYNLAALDENTANVIIEVIKNISFPVKLYVPYGSVIERQAIKEGIPIKVEAFADRNYNEDGTLVSRQLDNAIISDADKMFTHMYRMIINKKVKTIKGNEIDMHADTYCIHGDHPNVENSLKILYSELKRHHINVK